MAYTPGPWKYDFSSRNIDSRYGIVATVRKGNAGKTCWSNAALIASSPELLEGLQEIERRLAINPMQDEELGDFCRNLIKKALGNM
jgi:hypothetical protein